MSFNSYGCILVVSPSPATIAEPLNGVRTVAIEYSFGVVENLHQPISVLDRSDVSATLNVSEHCRETRAGFAYQALNCTVAQFAIQHQASAVLIEGLNGATLDLPRMLKLMGIPCFIAAPVGELNVQARQDVEASLADASGWYLGDWAEGYNIDGGISSFEEVCYRCVTAAKQPKASAGFDYSIYEFAQRDHPLLLAMQRPYVDHFAGCRKVLDLGCGSGVFLQLLQDHGIDAVGVERNPEIAEYGRGLGLDIRTEDALEFLENSTETFDGIYCSHFVEHLPFELVCRLISLLQQRLVEGGKLLLVFPDPESIRSQLLGFWRDPEHVRYYHPDLIKAVGEAQGLRCEWHSHEAAPHTVVSFSETAPTVAQWPSMEPIAQPKAQPTLWERLLDRLGICSRRRLWELLEEKQLLVAQLNEQNRAQQAVISQLKVRTDILWDVNRTWGWEDNAAIRLVKGPQTNKELQC
ncbi:class I SAM-dependent methyltransferase [Neptunomonas marina]|uniref:Class I SAM-dependent methyltransferase n=1 Tax=Neptunomonas marina TaxID=1815562 RepID=A0A437Q725_9GAMM|nr:class I SAM-dependent methyltransferase [Neptunomonas marina]RVU30319.1 class I SAM-dependent methyltransferase [Neptunomonas marina]